MGSSYKYIDVLPNDVINTIENPTWKKIASDFIELCTTNSKKYKITAGYSIHLNLKGKLSVNISTHGSMMQIRIQNPKNLNNLDEYSVNIRDQILKSPSCPSCRPDDGILSNHGEYVFEYRGKEYRKCRSWERNFKFYNLADDDICSLIKIVQREINSVKNNK